MFLFSSLFSRSSTAAGSLKPAASDASPAATAVPSIPPSMPGSVPPASRPGATADAARLFTVAEVARHNKLEDCWIIIDGRVYDVTDYVAEHPGGAIIAENAGRDSTAAFEDTGHSDEARRTLARLVVGHVAAR